MCKHFPAKWIALLSALVLPTIAKAADFPSQLWGRSVVVSWNTDGADQPSAVSSNNQLSVYVSGAGRSFSRMMAGGARTTRSDQGSIGSAASTAVSVYFENGALLADVTMISSALRVAIIFDAVYGKCNAMVIFGKDGGVPVRGRDIKASSCSITDGNVLVGR
jgi:hypothetical protein